MDPTEAVGVRVDDIRVEDSPDGGGRVRLAAEVSYDAATRGPETLWYEVSATLAGDLSRTGNPWVAALLPVAATLGEDLDVDAPVDASLLDGASRLLHIWADWFAFTSVVAIRCAEVTAVRAPGPGLTASFFSGGLDSSYTALSRRPLDELIFIGGFDLPLASSQAIAEVRHSLEETAVALGIPLVFVRSNWRETQASEVDWELVGHGALLASIALALEGRYGRVHIPTSAWKDDHWPWGSDPRTDPLLSTQRLTLRHDGVSLDKHERAAVVAASDVAREHLRVCWRSGDATNCGRCVKCRLTMLDLEVLVGLDRCPTFPARGLSLGDVRRLRVDAPWGLRRLLACREQAHRGGRTDLARAIDCAVRRSRHMSRWNSRIHRIRRGALGRARVFPLLGALRSGFVPAPAGWPCRLEGTDYPDGRGFPAHTRSASLP